MMSQSLITYTLILILMNFNNECIAQHAKCSRRNFCKINKIDQLKYHLLPKNKTRGEPCLADGLKGSCEHWKNCYTFIADGIDKKYPPLCSFDGFDPIVCCTSCKLVDDVEKASVISAKGNIVWTNEQKSWNQCISYAKKLPYTCKYMENWSVQKIWIETEKCFEIDRKFLGAKDSVGGRDAYRDEFPAMALLGYGLTEDSAQWLCGGTVISDRFVLTAAHCLSSSAFGEVTFAALGILKRSDPKELWQKYRIEDRIPHHLYHSPSKYHDIALLRTELTIKFSSSVLPACLPDLSRPAPDLDMFAFAAGWGAQGNRAALADTLQTVDLTEYHDSVCSVQYKKHRTLVSGYDRTTQMCYGDEDIPRDTCEGDSGGPLMSQGEVLECQHAVIGVTSFGHTCGVAGQAGVYTRVRYYVPWIESVVWPDP